MKKLNILLWVNFFLVLTSCKHQADEPSIFNMTFTVSQTACYDGDTLQMFVFVNNQPYTGRTLWNFTDIQYAGKNKYILIVPSIDKDSISLPLTVSIGSQTSTQMIRITGQAFRYPIVSYLNSIQPLLNSNCNFSGCHGNGSRAGKIELSCYDSVVKSVVPYNSNTSLLYIALVKTDPLRVMPPAGRLHDDKIEIVKTWIGQGAQNN